MNIKFSSIKIRNFLSIGSAAVDFDDRGFILVDGVNKNVLDNAKSNGSGKSSIFEAIVWTITGETIRGAKDVVNYKTTGGACCELALFVDGVKYEIARFKEDSGYGNNLKLYVDGQDVSGKGLRDTEKILGQYLPELTSQFLGSVIVLGQGLPQRFTNNTPSGRKEILENLSKSDFMIEDLKQKLNLRKVLLDTEMTKYSNEKIANQSKISVNNNLIVKRKADIESVEFTKTNISNIIISKQQQIDAEVLKIAPLEDQLKAVDVTSIEPLQVKLDGISNDLITVGGNVYGLRSNKSDLESRIRKAKEVTTECPYCHRPFDGVHVPDTSDLEAELEKVTAELKSEQEKQTELTNSQLSIKTEITKIQREYDSIKSSIENENKIISRLEKEKEDVKRDFDNERLKIDLWKTDIENAEKEIKEIELVVEEIDKQLDKLQVHFSAVQKLMSYASRDFRGYLLEGVVKFIEDKAKTYASLLFNTDSLEFKLDNNQIWIGIQGKSYENLSGGEKQKVDLIVQFSLRDMLLTLLGFSCNILVLDEMFDNLDANGCESLIELITTRLKDIESVFVVTHHADIDVPYDDKITIAKNDEGVSYIL